MAYDILFGIIKISPGWPLRTHSNIKQYEDNHKFLIFMTKTENNKSNIFPKNEQTSITFLN